MITRRRMLLTLGGAALAAPLGYLGLRGAGAEPEAARAAPPSEEPLPAGAGRVPDLESFIESLVAEDRFSGAVLVAHRSTASPLLQRAWGWRDREAGARNEVDTRFINGSINKIFTAAVVAQLAEQGKLSFDDRLAQYVPEFGNPAATEITLHQMLTHTSGLGDFWGQRYEQVKGDLRGLEDYLPIFADQPLAFEPGQGSMYSNAAFILLGLVVQRVSGEDYYEYMRRHFFGPAGMTATDSYSIDEELPNAAVPYTNLPETQPGTEAPVVVRTPDPTPIPQSPPGEQRIERPAPVVSNAPRRRVERSAMGYRGTPAGGGYTTVGDLTRFARSLRNNQLLSPEMTTQAFSPMPPPARGGYGSFYQTANGTPVVGMNGGSTGVNAWLDIYWELGYTVAVLANYDSPAAEEVAMKARELLSA